eukprot:TRINITY_DN32887_c0_g1_i1.p1 TRINITY_DN32887_c0_g1~~TRINITY_DN32887_c0_g1_i1.p1  ORF type:complete len:623 (-),score=92.71 TRINITY_DN32887_c0_g1_i1:471-2339(-)
MVLENKNVITAIKRLVETGGMNRRQFEGKTTTGKKNTEGAGSDKGLEEKQGSGSPEHGGTLTQNHSSAKLIQMEKRSKKSRIATRKRQVSECASLLAAPIQAQGQPPGCLKWRRWLPSVVRIPCLVLCLYLFVCSLEFLSTSFRLIAGKTAGSIFQNNELLTNPVVGLMIGVMFTVLVQSSSTCTSVIVSMVASGILDVKYAIPMIMGANIGTSLTNTLVSFTQATERDQFERAFAGATVHDCFNWLTVSVLLTLEVTTGYLYKLTSLVTNSGIINPSDNSSHHADPGKRINVLGAITKPLTSTIIQIDKSVLKCWALGQCQEDRLLKVWCEKYAADRNEAQKEVPEEIEQDQLEKCSFLFNIELLGDKTIGFILFLISLAILSVCLIFLVKLLHSLLQGAVADLAKKTINADIPHFPWLTGYIAIIMGAVLTFVVQSSSVFTSTLTPLVGCGLISVDRMYPLTLGSNIGTTTTAMLAAMAAEPAMLKSSIQIALVHLFFNLHGIMLFYPVPWMRWPLVMCKILGKTTANYRWFAIVYLLLMFFVFPGMVVSLSLLGKTGKNKENSHLGLIIFCNSSFGCDNSCYKFPGIGCPDQCVAKLFTRKTPWCAPELGFSARSNAQP